MAKFEIYQSQLKTTEPKTPEIGALRLPFSIAHEQGAAASALIKSVKGIFTANKANEDQNRFYEIITDHNIGLNKKLSDLSKGSNAKGAVDAFKPFFKLGSVPGITKENKEVKKLVQDWLNKKKEKLTGELITATIAHSADNTLRNDEKWLNQNAIDRASNNSYHRAIADKDFESWFGNVNNIVNYSTEQLSDKKEKKELLAKQFKVQFRTKNDPLAVIADKEKIIEDFGILLGNQFVNKARSALQAQVSNETLQKNLKEKADINQQIENFSDILERVNKVNYDPSNTEFLAQLPDLDDLYDAYNDGAINEAQYNALLDIYAKKEVLDDEELINMITTQLVIADTVKEIDDLNQIVNTSRTTLSGLNVKDINAYNKLFEKFKADPESHEDFKYFHRILKINLGDVDSLLAGLVGGTEQNPNKLTYTDSTLRFQRLVGNGMTPENAYLKVIAKIEKEKIPDIYSPNLQPLNFKFEDFEAAVQKQGVKVFENARNEIAKKYDTGEISMEDYKEDMKRMDLLEDVYDVRIRVGGKDFATKKREGAGTSELYKKLMKDKK